MSTASRALLKRGMADPVGTALLALVVFLLVQDDGGSIPGDGDGAGMNAHAGMGCAPARQLARRLGERLKPGAGGEDEPDEDIGVRAIGDAEDAEP